MLKVSRGCERTDVETHSCLALICLPDWSRLSLSGKWWGFKMLGMLPISAQNAWWAFWFKSTGSLGSSPFLCLKTHTNFHRITGVMAYSPTTSINLHKLFHIFPALHLLIQEVVLDNSLSYFKCNCSLNNVFWDWENVGAHLCLCTQGHKRVRLALFHPDWQPVLPVKAARIHLLFLNKAAFCHTQNNHSLDVYIIIIFIFNAWLYLILFSLTIQNVRYNKWISKQGSRLVISGAFCF